MTSPLDSTYSLVGTVSDLAAVVDKLVNLPASPPSLYIDLEGVNLCRYGSISIITIYVYPLDFTFLIDVHNLGDAAFTTPGTENPGVTLKSILEDPAVPVVLFDVRNDNDALANTFKVRLAGVIDIQLMEVACRWGSKRYLNGLSRVLRTYQVIEPREMARWAAVKEEGVRLFAPESGGSYDVFNQRPLSETLAKYCVQDVRFLKRLWDLFAPNLERPSMANWKTRVRDETLRRVALCDNPRYNPKGRERAMAPYNWQ
ncbi:hypothetical protein DRE_02624 [Drechslerella stenobrocha 248]|uniref:3'-5' exonuclease domain-containing protein n=1 Tax=Drechslerella stenobrocha 248 TaxID=1043628 RepID=W7IFW2_9PEZI|nr:hypothetical protein DRE_02624 [Drechslerella stenobrocha 248]